MSSSTIGEDRNQICNIIQQSGYLLDQGAFQDWTELFTAQGFYKAVSQNLDTGERYVWMKFDKSAASKYFRDDLPERVTDPNRRMHLISNVQIEFQSEKKAKCHSSFVIYRIDFNGAIETVFLGTYEDICINENQTWLIAERTATILNNPIATHLPI